MKTVVLLLITVVMTSLPGYAKPELMVRTGQGPVCSVAFSPDGKTLASGNSDGTIKLWEVASGKEVGSFSVGDLPIDVVWSADGKSLAAACCDEVFRLWDVSGQARRAMKAPLVVKYIALSPDGKTLATAGSRSPSLWSAESGTFIRKLHNQTPETGGYISENSITCMSWSANGKILAVGTEGDIVKQWDIASGKNLPTLECPYAPVYSLAFHPDCKTVAVGTADGAIRIWNPYTGKLQRKIQAHLGRIYGLAFSPDGTTLASGGHDKLIKMWDLSSHKVVRTFPVSSGSLRSLAFSPDGKTLAGTDDDAIRLWDVASGKDVETLSAPYNELATVACSPDGERLASINGHIVRIWALSAGPQVRCITSPDQTNWSVAFTPGQLVLQGSPPDKPFEPNSQIIQLLDPQSGGQTKKLTLCAAHNDPEVTSYLSHVASPQPGSDDISFVGHTWLRAPALSPDGKMLVASCQRPQPFFPLPVKLRGKMSSDCLQGREETTLKLYALPSLKLLHSQAGCHSYTWGPDSRKLAVSTLGGAIEIWDVLSWKKLTSFVPYSAVIAMKWNSSIGPAQDYPCPLNTPNSRKWNERGVVNSIAWSPDGKILATEFNGVIKLWRASSWELTKTLNPLPTGRELSGTMRYSADGKTLLLLEAESENLAFSPDSQDLITTSANLFSDHTARLWDVASGRLRLRLKEPAGRISSAFFAPDGKKIVTAGGDIGIWDAASGTELARLYSFGSVDWVVVTPDGRFDASPGATNMVYQRDGNRIFESGELKKDYFPGLLQTVLQK